ncbi:MAG: hypothetical protein HUU46_15365 [Candidatus Hydrogenedentes bacterium]|nr:hypothetical protein [Candidatus Hydrogenedentota bacterium]
MKIFAALSVLSLLSSFAALSGESPKSFAVGEGGRLFESPDVKRILERPYRIDVPMASTGKCLWAGHPTGWGFPRSSVHWFLTTPNGLGFDLLLTANDKPILPADNIAYPSHVQMSCGIPIKVEGAKWIASDDVLVTRLTLINTGDAPIDVTASAILPVETAEGEKDKFTWKFDHAGLTLNAIGSFPGFAPAPREPIASVAYTVEGEDGEPNPGSGGKDAKAAANGGAVLGSGFGGNPGNNAWFTFDVKERMENAAVTIRYARAMEGAADVAVQLPGQKGMMRRRFASTGGWGDEPDDFATQTFRIGPLEAGPAKIQILIITAGGNINVDTLYLHDAGAPAPGAAPTGTIVARTIRLEAGKQEPIMCMLAVDPQSKAAQTALDRIAALDNPLQDHEVSYNAWNLANVPAFSSPDEALSKQYWHRATSILRKNLFKVGEGRLADWGVAEGRWTASWYSNIISYGAGHQIRETRWLRDPQYVNGIISTWCANAKENGVFPNYIRPNEIGDGQYTDWITSTVWDAYCVHPDAKRLKLWADALKKNVDGWLATYDTDNDGLLTVDSHWWTGMEWQPSFFYFKDFDKDKQDQHLERVDLTAYVHGNARNLARILDAVGDKEGAKKYEDIAAKIRGAVERVMWDGASSFFYSVEPVTGEKAMVKEVIGVYPFYFSMFDADAGKPYLAAWNSILDPEEFWTAWPVASATKKCRAYSQDVNFNGKRVGGCMWNGPTWPHANSIVLSAMAAALREFPESPLSADRMYELFKSFTMAQFKDKDTNYPWTGEYYNGNTAEWRTDQRDYNHSTYIDILIADIAGLRPRNDDVLEVHPLISAQMPPFVIDGIRYRDHDISMLWLPNESGETQPDNLKGFRIYVDGKLVHHNLENAERIKIGQEI